MHFELNMLKLQSNYMMNILNFVHQPLVSAWIQDLAQSIISICRCLTTNQALINEYLHQLFSSSHVVIRTFARFASLYIILNQCRTSLHRILNSCDFSLLLFT